MSYNKIVVSIVFLGFSSLVTGMDRRLTVDVNSKATIKNVVKPSPTSVMQTNEDFFKQPKCMQRGQLGESGWLTPGAVRSRRDSLTENDTPIAQQAISPEERFYPRQRKASHAVAIAQAIPQQNNNEVDIICALLSECLGIK